MTARLSKAEKNRRKAAQRGTARAAKHRRPGGRPFAKGQSGNPAGKKKGTLNKVTRQVKDFCFGLVNDPVYQAKFQAAFQARTIDKSLEELVWHYAFGKPSQALDVNLTFNHEEYLASKTPGE